MNNPMHSLAESGIPSLRGAGVFRALNKCLPLGRKYHRFISLLNPSSGLVAIPFGEFEVVHPASWGSELAAILFFGQDLMPEFRLLPPILKGLNHGRLIDVGANIGLYTLMLRSVSSLPITAYEPQPFLCGLVQRNVSHNKLKQVEVRQVACGAERGEISFLTGINGAVIADENQEVTGGVSPSGTVSPGSDKDRGTLEQQAEETRHLRPVIRVPVTPLDSDLAEVPVALLKIDCEGFEQRILAGAMNLLETQRPFLLLELHPQEIEKHNGSPEQVLNYLRPYFDLEFWDFNMQRHYPRIVRSVLKHRRPKGYRFATELEMLKACEVNPRPFQIYVLGRPKKPRT